MQIGDSTHLKDILFSNYLIYCSFVMYMQLGNNTVGTQQQKHPAVVYIFYNLNLNYIYQRVTLQYLEISSNGFN